MVVINELRRQRSSSFVGGSELPNAHLATGSASMGQPLPTVDEAILIDQIIDQIWAADDDDEKRISVEGDLG